MSDGTSLTVFKEEGLNAGDRFDSNGLLRNRVDKTFTVNILRLILFLDMDPNL